MLDKSQSPDVMMSRLPTMGGMSAVTSRSTSRAMGFLERNALIAQAMSAIMSNTNTMLTRVFIGTPSLDGDYNMSVQIVYI